MILHQYGVNFDRLMLRCKIKIFYMPTASHLLRSKKISPRGRSKADQERLVVLESLLHQRDLCHTLPLAVTAKGAHEVRHLDHSAQAELAQAALVSIHVCY